MSDESPQRPWTEAEWEAFMRESEARAARFGDLLETLMDHPDRDAIIDKEMGWDRGGGDMPSVGGGEDDGEFDDDDFEFDDDAEDDEGFDDDDWDEEDLDPEEVRAFGEARRNSLKAIPAYALAYSTGLAVMDAMEPYASRRDPDSGDEVSELLDEAIGNALIPGAKIAGGHAMGYDDDQICGNIVCCKKALAAAEASREAFRRLLDGRHLPENVVNPLLEKLAATQKAIEDRIAELRSRVWWQ